MSKDWNPFMDFLINNRVDLSKKQLFYRAPLIVKTIETGNLRRLKDFLSKGIYLDKDIISDYDCILVACDKGKIDLFKYLMSYEPQIKDVIECISVCANQYDAKKQMKTVGKKYIYMIEKIIETQNFNLKENINDERIQNIIMTSSFQCSIEILQTLKKYGADFTHCMLNFSKMTQKKHLPIYHFLEENGCMFDNPVGGIYKSKCSSVLDSLFSNDFINKIDNEVIEFVFNYSSSEDILGVNNIRGNITNNLIFYKSYDVIAKAFQISKSVILPTGFNQITFIYWAIKNKIQSLIQYFSVKVFFKKKKI